MLAVPVPVKLGLVVLAAALWFALTVPAETPPRVAFVRPPGVATDKTTVVLQVRVDPHEDNRLLVVAAVEGDVVVRRSDEDLAGDKAPRVRWIRWRVTAGDLVLAAILYGAGGRELARDQRHLIVLAFQTLARASIMSGMEQVIVEIRAAEGGADAKLLVLEQFAIYGKLARRRGL